MDGTEVTPIDADSAPRIKVRIGRHGEQWRWQCADVVGPWHDYVDDRGFYATHAEALAAARTHQQLHDGVAKWWSETLPLAGDGRGHDVHADR